MKLLKNVKKTFRDMDKPMLIICIVLIVFGTLNIVTASSREAAVNLDKSIYYYFYKHVVILIASILAFLILIKIKTKDYGKLIIWVFIIVLGLNAFLVLKVLKSFSTVGFSTFAFFFLII